MLEELRQRLHQHPLYEALQDAEGLRLFMSRHVFCVWDFMSLLKALQRRLTCVEVPWRPPVDSASARLINEIVLGEESDDDGRGGHASHFELYLQAMQDAGADVAPLQRFLSALGDRLPVDRALHLAGTTPAVAAFVQLSLSLTEAPTHRLAAAFSLGREDLIPGMFTQLVKRLADADPQRFGRFAFYLERHIQLDADEHGPAARRLVERLAPGEKLFAEAEQTAVACLEARLALWDEITHDLRSRNGSAR
jgi:hypothetical protein